MGHFTGPVRLVRGRRERPVGPLAADWMPSSMTAPDLPPYKQAQAMFMDSALPSMARNQDAKTDAASKYRAMKDLAELYRVSGLEVPTPQELYEAVEGAGAGPEPDTATYLSEQRRTRRRGVLQKQRARRGAESSAREAVHRENEAEVRRLLGREDVYYAPQKVEGKPEIPMWNIGGRYGTSVSQEAMTAKVVREAGRQAGAALRERTDARPGARPGVQLPAARPKPKPPTKLEPMAGAPGIYVDETRLAEIQRTGGDPQDAIIDLSPVMADPERVERLRKVARAAGGKPAEIFTETHVPGVGYVRVDEKGKAVVIQKAPARWRLGDPHEVDGKTRRMWLPEPGQVGPDGKPLTPKVAWEEKLPVPVVGPEKDEIRGWEFDPATKKYVATLIETADGKPTGVTTRIGSPGFRPAGWGAPPSKDKAAYEVSFRKIKQKDPRSGTEVEGDAPVVEWLDKKTGKVNISLGDVLALRPEQAFQIGAEAETGAGAPTAPTAEVEYVPESFLEDMTVPGLARYGRTLQPAAEAGDERAQQELERVRQLIVQKLAEGQGKK